MESAMTRWFSKRWVWAGVFGTTAAFGLALAQGGKDAPPGAPRVGDVITMPFKDGMTKQAKVLKVDKQPNGTYLCEVKDTKSGETFFYMSDPTTEAKAAKQPETPKDKDSSTPKAKPRQSDPLLPSVKTPMPETPRDKSKSNSMMADPTQEPQKKPGLLARIFGRKTTQSATTMPAATLPGSSTSGKPGSPAMSGTMPMVPSPAAGASMPPAVRPTPSLTSPSSSIPLVPPSAPTPPGSSGEPPRTFPTQPAPAKPVTPVAPVSIPNASTPLVPPTSVPTPLPIPTPPPATTPAPPPSTPSGLPPIPIPPGGVSSAAPKLLPAGTPVAPTSVVPAAAPVMTPVPAQIHAPAAPANPAATAMLQEIQPHVTTLQTALAPSARILAAQALAGGRHGSTDTVKAALFQAATSDPCPMVRASCIDELGKLGYHDPAFLAHLEKSCNDPSEDVRTSAKEALMKLTSRK
jgi:hypothetical protein